MAFFVRLAWAYAIGCKTRTSLIVGILANSKGVRGDAESEGSWRQILGLTNRNCIGGCTWRTNLQNKTKSDNYPNPCAVNAEGT